MGEPAKAYPRKRFFQEMFVRDISLEDCILDLVDNSIDGLIRSRNLDLSSEVLQRPPPQVPDALLPAITLTMSTSGILIEDNCGGIDAAYARKEVFTFGHGEEAREGQLGIYGIGLKRAIFKIGNSFRVESHTVLNGFTAGLGDIEEWVRHDERLEDWTIPLEDLTPAESLAKAGTSVTITNLRPEVMMRMSDDTLTVGVHTRIAQTYAYIIGRYVIVTVNGKRVNPVRPPLGVSDDIDTARDHFEEYSVKVTLLASLAARGPDEEWHTETAGWYVFCNGRGIVTADRTDLTGWGTGALPLFQNKHRGFIGMAFFESSDPSRLPWTTTKRGINRESPVYQLALNRMRGLSRPIINFLDRLYTAEVSERMEGRAIASKVKDADIHDLVGLESAPFLVRMPRGARLKSTVRVQYEAEREDLERIRKHLREPGLSAQKIGKLTFAYYLETECPR